MTDFSPAVSYVYDTVFAWFREMFSISVIQDTADDHSHKILELKGDHLA